MTSRVDEAALAGTLAAILERVRRGERFEIARGGQVFAVLAPPVPALSPVGITGRELAARLGHLVPPGDGFGDDLEEIHAAQGQATAPAWPD